MFGGLLFAVTLILKLTPGAAQPAVTQYEVLSGSSSGNHVLVATLSSWVSKPDGSIELSVPNWDETVTKFVAVRARNSFGPSANKSNEVIVGRPTTAPIILDASGQ